ncbi:MAG: hypothetical protein WCO06_07680 [Candidatus Roizmanbacteria bacterium]
MKRQKSTQEELLGMMSTILIPQEYLKDFDVANIEDHPSEWIIDLFEKETRIPKELVGKEVILDGFCNPISLMSNAFSLKKIYLQLHRRRWKGIGSNKDYTNEYDLHLPGMKTTKEFSAFLKEIDR